MRSTSDIRRVVNRLRREALVWGLTTMDAERDGGADTFRVLIGTVLSHRTKDEHTAAATRRLFRRARTPRGMLRSTTSSRCPAWGARRPTWS